MDNIADLMHVSQLVPEDQKIVSIYYDSPVSEAMELMRSHAFNQLPVLADDGSVVGLFSYRSFASHLGKFRKSDDVLSKQVGDLVDEPYFVRATENLSSVIERINTDGAILIGNEQAPLAVATVHDLSNFMWTVAQPFILIGDIETTLRRIMNDSCPQAELPQVIGRGTLGDEKSFASLDELPLGDLINVLKNGTNFGQYFKVRFNDMNFTSQTLDPVTPIRNRLFHFRAKPSDEELETLNVARAWLNRKWRAKRAVVQE